MTRCTWVALGLAVAACAPPPAAEPQHGHHGARHHGGDGMRHDFSDVDTLVTRFEDPARAAWQKPDAVVAAMHIAPGAVVADIGTGTGYFLPWLVPAVGPTGRILALDVEPRLVAYVAGRASQAGWTQVQARSIAFDASDLAPESLDHILIVDTWHHIDAREAYSRRLFAALRPGGQVVVVDYKRKSPRGPAKRHKLKAGRVARELEAAGFTTRVDKRTLPDQYIVFASRP